MTGEAPEDSAGVVRRFVDAWPEMAAAAATGAADWAITGTPTTGAAAPALALLLRFADEARAARQRRGSQLVDLAAEQLGGIDELERLATSDDARMELTARTIEAAMQTTLEQKIRALSRVLTNGLDGHATVDASRILLAALGAIEAPHIQVLAVLRNKAAPNQVQAETERTLKAKVDLLSLTAKELAEQLPGHKAVLGALTQVLVGHDLIVPVSGGMTFGEWGGPQRWAITDLGLACLQRLEEGQDHAGGDHSPAS